MECDQLKIHNQVKKENVFINIPKCDHVKDEKEIFYMGHQNFEHNKTEDEGETERYHLSRNKIIKEESVDEGVDKDNKIESKDNSKALFSVTSEEDVFNSYRMNSCDEEDEKVDWEEIIKTFFSTSSKEEILNLIRLNSCDEEDEKVDWEEIIKTFFSTSSKEEILNLIRLGESYITPDDLELSCMNKDDYMQPYFHINDIKKLIKSKKQKVKQRTMRTKRKSTSVTFICDECKKEFSTWWLRRKHWIDTEHKLFEICSACNKPYFNLQKHIYIIHSETLFFCSTCGKVFINQNDVDNHSSVHTSNQNSYCFVCNKNIDGLEALKKHVKTHFNLLLLMCDVCEMEFVDYFMLEDHLRLFHYTCPLCNTMFNMAPSLYEHYRHVHKNNGTFSCENCDKNFKTKAKMKEHIKRVHLKQFPFKCSECDQKFVSKQKLKDHIIVKHEEKQFECDICAKKFSFQGSLISHMKFHSENKKVEFKCHFCNTVYERKEHLKLHLHGPCLKGFSCKECEVNFSCRTKYKEHVKEHKEKNIKFECDYCTYSHDSEPAVKRHMCIKHPCEYLETKEDAVCCQVCGHLCSTKHELDRHLRIKHGLYTKKRRKQT